MRFFSPFFMQRGEFLTVKGMMQKAASPVIINLENYGRRVIIPVEVRDVYENTFTSKFRTGYPALYMDHMRNCELPYEFEEGGVFVEAVSKEDMRVFTSSYDTYICFTKTTKYLRNGDILLCNAPFI